MWVYDWEAWVRQLEAGCAVLEVVNGPAVSKFAKIAENGYAFY